MRRKSLALRFLPLATLIAVGLVAILDSPARGGNPYGAFYSSANNRIFWFIQFSDTHIGTRGTSDSNNLNWMVTTGRSVIAPEFLVVSGDLTDSTGGNIGYPSGPYQSEWDEYKAILANAGVNASFYYDLPGNHDGYSDQHFSYYLSNSIQGQATEGTQVSWIREFPFGKYHFLGVNTADNSGAPFSVSWPFGDYAGLDTDELAFINAKLSEYVDADLTMVFGHHPVWRPAGAGYTFLFYGHRQFVSALDARGVSLYGFGHTHTASDVQFTGNAYTGFMTGGGIRYLNVDSLGRNAPFSYNVIAVDCNGVSSVSATVGTWPVVLITTPVARLLSGTPNPYSYNVPAAADNPIRALVFDAGPVSSVLYRIDAEATWYPMSPVDGNPRLYEGIWNASTLAAGDHTITVQAMGMTTQSHAITVTVDSVGPPVLTSVSVDPATVLGGNGATGTAALNNPAPLGGAEVSLTLSDPAAQVPSSVTVLEGQTTAIFAVTTSPVAADAPVVISATYNAVTQTATLTVTAPVAALVSVSLDPTSVLGGNASTGTVTLDYPAPVGGAVVSLSGSDNAAAQVPSSVTVLEGRTTAIFAVTTSSVVTNTPVVISATYNAITQTANLSVTAPPVTLSSISLSPDTVVGGAGSTGTVTLDITAQAGGAIVTLTSSDPAAQVPSSVTVLEGQTTAAFPVTTSPVVTDTPAVISASYNAVTQTATLAVTVSVAVLTSVRVDSASVLGGASSAGTVTLDNPAPLGGAIATLTASDPVVQVPATVTVEAGQTTATFAVTTSPVAADTPVVISATYSAVTQTATLTVTAPVAALVSVSLDPTSVLGGGSSTGTVTLDIPAPAGGAVVSLTSSDPSAQVPATVTVEAGQTMATFAVTTSPVVTDTPAVISATYNAITQTANLSVTAPPPTLRSIRLSPDTVAGGAISTGTVTLDIPAPTGGAVVTLTSGDPAAQVPAAVTVEAGQTTATFAVTTSPVTADTPVVISAGYDAVIQTATLTVTVSPATLGSISLSPVTVVGGATSAGTVALDIPAPAGGAIVTLTSSSPAAQVPLSVMVLEGQTTATFAVTTSPVAADTPAVISAMYNAVAQTATLTVTVSTATLSSVSLSPETVVGGSPSTCTVILSGPAPLGGALVTLFSSNTVAAQVPSSVPVPEGQATATFIVTTTPVSSNQKPAISAAYRGTNTSTRLTVMAPVLAAHSISPNSVTGGNPSTGTVTLNGPAPAGGAVVTLFSSNTAAVQVPASVTVAAGETTATYPIATSAVTSPRTVTISGRGGYVTVSANITVTP